MSSRKENNYTLAQILKRKGSRGGFKELTGCAPLVAQPFLAVAWVSFLRRVPLLLCIPHVTLAFKPALLVFLLRGRNFSSLRVEGPGKPPQTILHNPFSL